MTGIYKITSPTGRVYIGQSLNIERRFGTYKRLKCETSVKLYRSFLKHGTDNHSFEVIEECEKDMLNERERYWQEYYSATSENNLNCILTQTATKKKVIKPLSEKQKQQISKVHKGKVYSEQTREKIKAARAKQIITDEHRKSISENSGSAVLLLDTQTGIFYPSIKEASEAKNIKRTRLVDWLLGRHPNKSSLIRA